MSRATKVTPPKLAKRYCVSAEKVLAWIHSGELAAINGATRPDGRPRYLIDESAIAEFEARRAVQVSRALQKRQRRKRKQRDIIEFF